MAALSPSPEGFSTAPAAASLPLVAAGVVIVREAGGLATDYQGKPVDIRAGWIVASNGRFHDDVLEVIRTAREQT